VEPPRSAFCRNTRVVRRLETTYSTLVWSPDGTQVTKSRPPGAYTRSRFRNELRVNRLVTMQRPPVATPALINYDVHTRSLTFEALPGAPLGPKYPQELAPAEIDAILSFGHQLRSYTPRRRWLRRIESRRRLALARNIGLLDTPHTATLIEIAREHHQRLRFAHGDLTARNVLRRGEDTALIDWEWAGLYPPGYDAAFLWFTVGEVEGGRSHIESSLRVDEKSFLLCALLIELWHLQWYVPRDFLEPHLATRDELVDRLCG
jgi:tRNA A-37 threonylcarbamoyl transferase component Bud32